jgi:hypothetical protein
MAAWRQAMELAIGEEDLVALGVIARSRSEPARRVERARMLLAYRDYPSFFATWCESPSLNLTVPTIYCRRLWGDARFPGWRVHAGRRRRAVRPGEAQVEEPAALTTNLSTSAEAARQRRRDDPKRRREFGRSVGQSPPLRGSRG